MPVTPVFGWVYPTPLDPATANLWGPTLNTLFDDVDAEMGTRSAAYDFAGFQIITPEIIDAQEDVYNLGNISGAVSVDYTNGHYQYGVLTGNVTGLTITNWPASGKAGWMTIELIQDGTGNRTLTLGSAYKTADNEPIVLTQAANARDKLRVETRDAGATIDTFVNLNMS